MKDTEEAHAPAQTRREFCTHACRAASVAALGSALGSILQGCGSGGNPTSPSGAQALPIVNATAANGVVVLTIDSTSPLFAVGSAALIQVGNAFLLVAHTSQGSFNAFNATCTHQACTITGYGSQTFVCPCHGSQFDTTGRALSGPARAPLLQYRTQLSNDVLTITT